MSYVLALDQGTTSSRAIVFNAAGQIVAQAQQELAQHFPRPGWVEHDASAIWRSQRDVMQQAVRKAGIAASRIAAVGIANQRETTVLWDRATGLPLAPAIVWQDRRTAHLCDALRDGLDMRAALAASEGQSPGMPRTQGASQVARIQHKTGLVLDAYFSATKLAWLLHAIPGARARAERGELAFGTMDSWLVWNLTGGAVHATDASNASRTLLFNIHTQRWDADLLNLFAIPASVLPQVVPSSGVLGQLQPDLLGAAIPIAALAGDQQAATFGQACFAPGMAKNTYGTGCFVLMNTGTRPVASRHKLLTTVGWQGPNAVPASVRTAYCLEGAVFMGGATIQWLRDGLGIVSCAADVEAMAASVPDSGDVHLVPAFTGLGAPDWDSHARGLLIGLTRGSTRAHIARAALQAIALQSHDVLAAMQQDAGVDLKELRVDGGASHNNLLMQMQADMAGVPVVRPTVTETTALGAAYLAGLAVGAWSGADEITAQWQVNRRFEPQMPEAQRQAAISRWREAVERAKAWARE